MLEDTKQFLFKFLYIALKMFANKWKFHLPDPQFLKLLNLYDTYLILILYLPCTYFHFLIKKERLFY